MRDRLKCLRCGTEMVLLKREQLQLGKTGWILGDLGNLMAGALDVDIVSCPGCGKLEFFRGSWSGLKEQEEDSIARIRCDQCGQLHDMDDPKCPFCGTQNKQW